MGRDRVKFRVSSQKLLSMSYKRENSEREFAEINLSIASSNERDEMNQMHLFILPRILWMNPSFHFQDKNLNHQRDRLLRFKRHV